MYWLLVWLVRSLKSSHKEALRNLLLFEDYNDLTSPTSNQIPDIHIAVSPCRVGSVSSVSASRTAGREFATPPGHTKDHHKKWYKMPPCMARNALGLELGSAAQLSKRPGSVWNCLWGNALIRSPGIIRKSRVSYTGPGFLSSATWPSLPTKHYNGLINLSIM